MNPGIYGNRHFSIAPVYLANHFEPWLIPMYKMVLGHLQLTEKHLLLDAGCGSGLFSNIAIKAGVQVIAMDNDPGLLEIARKRNPLNNFIQENPESMPFANDSFHVVVSLNSHQHPENMQYIFNEAMRVLRPGGRLVISICENPELCESFAIFRSICSLVHESETTLLKKFASEQEMEAAIGKTGLTLKYKSRVSCPFLFATLSDGIKGFMGTEPAARAVKHCNSEMTERRIEEALGAFEVTDGFYFMQNRMLVFTAEK